MSKHTPGPWELETSAYEDWDGDNGFHGRIVGGNGEIIYAGPSSFFALKGDANARLIAAAPEMFEAFGVFLAKLDEITHSNAYLSVFSVAHVHHAGYSGDVWTDELNAARAALRKAVTP